MSFNEFPWKSVWSVDQVACQLQCRHQWRAEVWWCPGRLLDWMPPYQILVFSSGVWWSLLLDIRCLWRHNMTSYSRLQTTFWRSLLTQHAYYSTRTLLVVHICVTVMNISVLQVRRPEQKTALNAKTEQFIPAKTSGNAFKQGSRTHSVLCQRSSQLQKYKAARMSCVAGICIALN